MNWERYKEQVADNGREYIDEALAFNHNISWDYLFDEMFVSDRVTGNGSGSYTMNREKAKKLVTDLLWDSEALASIKEMGVNGWPSDPELADVVARCATLYEVASELQEYYEERRNDLYGID